MKIKVLFSAILLLTLITALMVAASTVGSAALPPVKSNSANIPSPANITIDKILYNSTYSINSIFFPCELDGDNKKEIIIISTEINVTDNTKYYYLNATSLNIEDGTVIWQKKLTEPQQNNYFDFSAKTADFDGDGKDELLFFDKNRHLLYTCDENGTMYNLSSYLISSYLEVVDWNSDGSEDMVQVAWSDAARSFNVTVIYDLKGQERKSVLYSYSETASICSVAAGDFNTSSNGPELAISCSSGKVLIINSAENDATAYPIADFNVSSTVYLFNVDNFLLYYYVEEGNTSLGVFRDKMLWRHKYNQSLYNIRVADFDLDSKQELTFPIEYPYYLIIDVESGASVNKSYVPIPISIGEDKKLIAYLSYWGYATPETMDATQQYASLVLRSNMLFKPHYSSIGALLDEGGRYVATILFPENMSFSVYFDDYDGDNVLEGLGVSSGYVALVELNPASSPITINNVFLMFYNVSTSYWNSSQLFFYLSNCMLVIGLGLTGFYYARRRMRALKLDRALVKK